MISYISILAVADIHSPRYLHNFIASLHRVRIENLDLIVLAGDIVDRGNVSAFKPVLDVLNTRILRNREIPMIAVFGNEEYMDREVEFYRKYNTVKWLNDEKIILRIQNQDICIVGSRGSLQKPTSWQERNIPNIANIYRDRLEKIKCLLRECRSLTPLTILVTHYATTFVTVKGEPVSVYPYLGVQFIEKLSQNEKPIIAIHGHAHNAKNVYAVVNGVEVYNVSLPARNGVTLIRIPLTET